MKCASLSFMLFITATICFGQFRKMTSVQLKDNPVLASVDRPGEIYILYRGGHLDHYDDQGERQQEVDLPFVPDTFDPRDGSRLFASSKEAQYMYFSIYNVQQTPEKIDSAFAIHPLLTCSSGDYDILTLDSADWSLKKINLKTKRLLYETVLGDKVSKLPALTIMKEYQNFIFMVDRTKGIYIFNMIGNLLQFLPAHDLRYIGFLGEELYYLNDNSLFLFDLFTTETRKIKLPDPADFALLTDQRLYLIKDKKLDIFSVKP